MLDTAVRKEEKELHLEPESIRLLGEMVRVISDCKYIKERELECWHAYRCIQARTCERAPKKARQPDVVMPMPVVKPETVPTKVEAPIAAVAA